MNESEARAKLVDLTAANTFPTLTDEQVDRLLRSSRRVDVDGVLPSDDTEWAAATDYVVDDLIVPTVRSGRAYKVTVAGTSGATEPTWPTVHGDTVTLDGVTYEDVTDDHAIWSGPWDFNRAAAEGWRIKAANVSNRHDFGSNQGNYNPSQVFEHCVKMAEYYASRQIGTIDVESVRRWDGRGGIPGAHLPWAK